MALMWRHCKDKTAKQDSPNANFKHAVEYHKTMNDKLQMITYVYSHPHEIYKIERTYHTQIYDICDTYSPAYYKHSDGASSGV